MSSVDTHPSSRQSAPRKRTRRRVPELMPVSLPGRPANSNRTGADIIPLDESPRRRFQRELAEFSRLVSKADKCEDAALRATFLYLANEYLVRAWPLHSYGSQEERALLLYLQRRTDRDQEHLRRKLNEETAIVLTLTTGHTVEGRA